MAKKQPEPPKPRKPAQPKHDQPHSGVDRRKKDMGGRKYAGHVFTKY